MGLIRLLFLLAGNIHRWRAKSDPHSNAGAFANTHTNSHCHTNAYTHRYTYSNSNAHACSDTLRH